MPRALWKKKQEAAKESKKSLKIDGIFKLKKQVDFDRDELLDSVSKLIACGDQVITDSDLPICSNMCQHPAVVQVGK
jgi:hypothetical protein